VSIVCGLDAAERYSWSEVRGVAFYISGEEMDWTEPTWYLDCEEDHEHDETCYLYDEPERIGTGRLRIVMVGDDHPWLAYPEDLTPLTAPVCECGQIGCWAPEEE
jgi:hypothetical protein